MNRKTIEQKLESMVRDELNVVARRLKIAKYRSLKKEELVAQIILSDEDKLAQNLRVRWWDRNHNHVYGICTVVALILGIAFYFWPRDSIQATSNDSSNSPISSSPISSSPSSSERSSNAPSSVSFREYFERLETLSDRNFERDRFVKKLMGMKVKWRGLVSRVSSHDTFVLLLIRAYEDSAGRALISFQPSWSTQLFALQNGDVVEVEAIYRGGPTSFPDLDGINVTTVEIPVND